MSRHVVYLLQATVLIVLQANLVTLLSVRSITPDLLLIFIVYLAVKEGQLYTLTYGFSIGLILDLTSGGVVGLSALSKTIAAFVAGYFYSENKITLTLSTYRFLLLVFFAAFAHNTVYFIVFTQGSDVGVLKAVFGYGLASAVFTTMVSILPMLVSARRRLS